jgi:hypothetical protein
VDIKVNVNRKYVVNGKEYHSIEEMPEDVRALFEKVGTSGTQRATGRMSASNRIIFNGTEYESVDSMPRDARDIYERAITTVTGGSSSSGSAGRDDIRQILADFSSDKRDSREGGKKMTMQFESSFSPKKVLAAVLAVGLLVLLYLLIVHGG